MSELSLQGILMKLIITFSAAFLTFWLIDGITWWAIGTIAFVTAVINYLVGDLILLKSFASLTAAVGEALMALVTALAVSLLWPGAGISILSLAIYAGVVGVAEFWYHSYLKQLRRLSEEEQ